MDGLHLLLWYPSRLSTILSSSIACGLLALGWFLSPLYPEFLVKIIDNNLPMALMAVVGIFFTFVVVIAVSPNKETSDRIILFCKIIWIAPISTMTCISIGSSLLLPASTLLPLVIFILFRLLVMVQKALLLQVRPSLIDEFRILNLENALQLHRWLRGGSIIPKELVMREIRQFMDECVSQLLSDNKGNAYAKACNISTAILYMLECCRIPQKKEYLQHKLKAPKRSKFYILNKIRNKLSERNHKKELKKRHKLTAIFLPLVTEAFDNLCQVVEVASDKHQSNAFKQLTSPLRLLLLHNCDYDPQLINLSLWMLSKKSSLLKTRNKHRALLLQAVISERQGDTFIEDLFRSIQLDDVFNPLGETIKLYLNEISVLLQQMILLNDFGNFKLVTDSLLNLAGGRIRHIMAHSAHYKSVEAMQNIVRQATEEHLFGCASWLLSETDRFSWEFFLQIARSFNKSSVPLILEKLTSNTHPQKFHWTHIFTWMRGLGSFCGEPFLHPMLKCSMTLICLSKGDPANLLSPIAQTIINNRELEQCLEGIENNPPENLKLEQVSLQHSWLTVCIALREKIEAYRNQLRKEQQQSFPCLEESLDPS